ncbi:hypothetical protein MTR_8g058935 [Medicago truncatula]|uniref:RNase III domain-containing protein n=1 Tax=Medicago truncatula TaxID=3880 RepID=A0A072U0X8_MEDTR|nr:hypothetical protein MTR_8g058935 [Medicago truncatula]
MHVETILLITILLENSLVHLLNFIINKNKKANLSHSITKTKNVTQTLTHTEDEDGDGRFNCSSGKDNWLHIPQQEALEDALTHTSYPESVSYERLEFVGDAREDNIYTTPSLP